MNFEEAMKEMEGVVINLDELPFAAFEVWFEDQDFYTNMRFIHGDKLFDKDGGAYRVLPVQMTYLAWLVGRAGIKEMDEVIKLQDADLRKYEKQIEGLKEQLNNMEACYIEKKKEVEELQGQINASKSSQPKLHKTEIGDCLHFSTTMFHDGKATCFDCDAVVNHKREVIGVMQTRSLRGAND